MYYACCKLAGDRAGHAPWGGPSGQHPGTVVCLESVGRASDVREQVPINSLLLCVFHFPGEYRWFEFVKETSD